jgi:hypothetical protein
VQPREEGRKERMRRGKGKARRERRGGALTERPADRHGTRHKNTPKREVRGGFRAGKTCTHEGRREGIGGSNAAVGCGGTPPQAKC